MTGTELLRLPLTRDRGAPGRARDAVKRLQAIDPVRDDAVLVVSELVSSAVLEAYGEPREPGDGEPREAGAGEPRETIELIATEVLHGVELVVATQGTAVRPHPAAMSASVVSAVARSWGLEWQGERTELWAHLAV
jgi:hypothetical protein